MFHLDIMLHREIINYAIEIINLKHTISVVLTFSTAACSDGSDANTCLHHLTIIRLCSNVIPTESPRDIFFNLNFDIPRLRNRLRKTI